MLYYDFDDGKHFVCNLFYLTNWSGATEAPLAVTFAPFCDLAIFFVIHILHETNEFSSVSK